MPQTEKIDGAQRPNPLSAHQIYAMLNLANPRGEGSRKWGALAVLEKIAEKHGLKPQTLYKVCTRYRRHPAAERDIEEAANVAPGTFFPLDNEGGGHD